MSMKKKIEKDLKNKVSDARKSLPNPFLIKREIPEDRYFDYNPKTMQRIIPRTEFRELGQTA